MEANEMDIFDSEGNRKTIYDIEEKCKFYFKSYRNMVK